MPFVVSYVDVKYHPLVPVVADDIVGKGPDQTIFPLSLPVRLHVPHTGTITTYQVVATNVETLEAVNFYSKQQPVDMKFNKVGC